MEKMAFVLTFSHKTKVGTEIAVYYMSAFVRAKAGKQRAQTQRNYTF